MPEVQNLFFNDVAYGASNYESIWVNVSASKYYTLSVFCSADCEIRIQSAADDDYQIICTTAASHVGGDLFTITRPTAFAFIRLSLVNIVSSPCDLKVQAYFFLDE